MSHSHKRIATACLASAFVCQLADAQEIIETQLRAETGHVYLLLTPSTWTAAQSAAESMGGNLATINDSAENAWVIDAFADPGDARRNLWIGLTDSTTEGTYVWVSGDPSPYRRWSPQEPTTFFATEDYVYIIGNGIGGDNTFWNNVQDFGNQAAPIYGVVELDICSIADLAPPYGLLDLSDANAFAAGFVGMDPIADLTADGLFDLADINLFVTAFVGGCP